MILDDKPLRVLVCIGGGPEAYETLAFAARLSRLSCADVALLYVRPQDSGLNTGGMEPRVARENVLDWGLELPGMSHLNKARKILLELGEINSDNEDQWQHRELSGDPAGEYIREYRNACGGVISLRLRTAADVTSAVADEADRFDADLIIVGGTHEPKGGLLRLLSPKAVSLSIAAHLHRSVIVARHLDPNQGHLVCVQDTPRSRAMLPEAIRYGHACECPITILSVAQDSELDPCRQAAEEAAQAFRDAGIEPADVIVEQGDPTERIVQHGRGHSLIVMAESEKPWFAKSFSVAHEVAAKAESSVLIIKNDTE